MDRERAQVLLVGVLCVLAVVAAAATIASPEQTQGSPGGDSLQDDGSDPKQGEGGDSNADPIGEPGNLGLEMGTCIPWLYSAQFWFGVALVAATIWLVARYRQNSILATAYLTVLALPFTFVWLLLSKCGADENTPTSIVPSDVVATPEGGNGSFGLLGDSGVFGAPVWVVLAIAVVGIGVVALAVVRDAYDGEDPDEEVPEAIDGERYEDVAALGSVAGRAADRIERSAGVDNEIYRAWVEMTEHLEVEHPESSTPGEFARAAIDAGVDDETVAELTDLFERVRYGDETPTTEREARAVDALRAIEGNYTDLDEVWQDDE